MTKPKKTYNQRAIYELLLAAFTPQELRRFCRLHPDFEPLLARFGDKYNLADMADEVVDYCRTRRLWEPLLAGIKEYNPYQYAAFEDRLIEPAPPLEAPKPLPKVDAAEQAQRLEQLYLDGLYAFRLEEWDQAVRCFQAIVAEQPDYRDAPARLREAKRRRDQPRKELRDLYLRAGQAIDAEDWAEAQWLLSQVQERQPGYRQTGRLLARVEAMLPAPGEVRLFGGVEMVYVPAGKFWMGSDDDDPDARDNEKPRHEVYLDAFWIDRTPVTNQEYRRFVEATGHRKPEHWTDGRIPAGKEDHPVAYMNWHDAQAYCRWRGEQADVEIRLPTEAEWEKGARGTDKRRYPWGNEFDPEKCNSKEGGPNDTTPVGHYSPAGDSPLGLVDMAGNVWEWCQSKYGEMDASPKVGHHYRPDEGREDLEGDDTRILRGGSWYNDAATCRCSFRVRVNLGHRYDNIGGFRCAGASSSVP